MEDPATWAQSTRAFAVLLLDQDGFAVIDRLVREEPPDLPAVPVVARLSGGMPDGEIFIQWPTLQRYDESSGGGGRLCQVEQSGRW